MAGKSVALKSYKFQYNDLILWLSMRSAHVCEALCQLKVICVSADYLDCILPTSKNNDGLFIYYVFNLFVRCIHRAVFTVVTEKQCHDVNNGISFFL